MNFFLHAPRNGNLEDDMCLFWALGGTRRRPSIEISISVIDLLLPQRQCISFRSPGALGRFWDQDTLVVEADNTIQLRRGRRHCDRGCRLYHADGASHRCRCGGSNKANTGGRRWYDSSPVALRVVRTLSEAIPSVTSCHHFRCLSRFVSFHCVSVLLSRQNQTDSRLDTCRQSESATYPPANSVRYRKTSCFRL